MIKTGHLILRDQQELYWESAGNPDGIPVVYLHGGPGGGAAAGHRKHFNLEKYFVICFDQRGCGRSRPLASPQNLESNNTQNLIEDIEELRTFFKIKKWTLFGVSWGTFLGLAYAQAFPQSVERLVLAAIHIPTKEVVNWITEQLAITYPVEWNDLFSNYSSPIINHCYEKIISKDENIREQMAKDWCKWEDTHMSLDPNYTPFEKFKDTEFRMIFSMLVIHYWKNHGFIDETIFYENLENIQDHPIVMIHGRLDISSPMKIPWKISQYLNNFKLIIVPDEGHGGPKMSAEINNAFSLV